MEIALALAMISGRVCGWYVNSKNGKLPSIRLSDIFKKVALESEVDRGNSYRYAYAPARYR